MKIPGGYLLFLGDVTDKTDAKTAFGLLHWRPELCVGQFCLGPCRVDLGIPDRTPQQAIAAGARTLVIGVAPFGGAIAPAWVASIVAALDAGLDVASGMHTRLGTVPEIAAAAARNGRTLFDVRYADRSFPIATGAKRRGLRLLTVGTDCAIGKKYAALSIARALKERGRKATFRATGQTGILISGGGVAIDAVISDFTAGAAEWLSPDNDTDHWDIIEGQGSLFHPAYAGVTLGLIHGSQPDAIVVCHDPKRVHLDGYPAFPIPELGVCAERNLQAARLTNPAVRWVGISVNTSDLSPEARDACLGDLTRRHGVPSFDPLATGAGALADTLPGG